MTFLTNMTPALRRARVPIRSGVATPDEFQHSQIQVSSL